MFFCCGAGLMSGEPDLFEQNSWERRRNHLHISATITMALVLYLSIRGRPARHHREVPDFADQSSSEEEHYQFDKERPISSPPDWRVNTLREGECFLTVIARRT